MVYAEWPATEKPAGPRRHEPRRDAQSPARPRQAAGRHGARGPRRIARYLEPTRAAGLSARDVYGVRVADSPEYRSLGKSGDITRTALPRGSSPHGYGWFPLDPTDVRKVVLGEQPGLTLADPVVQKARAKLFVSAR